MSRYPEILRSCTVNRASGNLQLEGEDGSSLEKLVSKLDNLPISKLRKIYKLEEEKFSHSNSNKESNLLHLALYITIKNKEDQSLLQKIKNDAGFYKRFLSRELHQISNKMRQTTFKEISNKLIDNFHPIKNTFNLVKLGTSLRLEKIRRQLTTTPETLNKLETSKHLQNRLDVCINTSEFVAFGARAVTALTTQYFLHSSPDIVSASKWSIVADLITVATSYAITHAYLNGDYYKKFSSKLSAAKELFNNCKTPFACYALISTPLFALLGPPSTMLAKSSINMIGEALRLLPNLTDKIPPSLGDWLPQTLVEMAVVTPIFLAFWIPNFTKIVSGDLNKNFLKKYRDHLQ